MQSYVAGNILLISSDSKKTKKQKKQHLLKRFVANQNFDFFMKDFACEFPLSARYALERHCGCAEAFP